MTRFHHVEFVLNLCMRALANFTFFPFLSFFLSFFLFFLSFQFLFSFCVYIYACIYIYVCFSPLFVLFSPFLSFFLLFLFNRPSEERGITRNEIANRATSQRSGCVSFSRQATQPTERICSASSFFFFPLPKFYESEGNYELNRHTCTHTHTQRT